MLFRPHLAAAAMAVAFAPPSLAAPLQLALRDEVRLVQRRLTLADLVITDDQAAKAALERIDMSAVVRSGYTARLSRAQVALRLAGDASLGTREIAWGGASGTVIRMASETISAGKLAGIAVDAAQARLGGRYPGVSFAPSAALADTEVPLGCTHLRPRALAASALATKVPVWVDAMAGSTPCRSILVTLTANWSRQAYVARRDLDAGTRAGADDFELRVRNLASLDSAAIAPQPGPAEWRLRRQLRAGEVLTDAAVAGGQSVLSGDQVRLLSRSGPIAIETAGTALANAEPGQRLAVRPTGGTAIVTGRLDTSGIVFLE